MGSKLAPLLSAYCLIALFELEENIFFAPSIKLLENAVCQKHYAVLDPNQVPVNEAFCKTGQIQSQPSLCQRRVWCVQDRSRPVIPAFLTPQGLIYVSFSAANGYELWKSCRRIVCKRSSFNNRYVELTNHSNELRWQHLILLCPALAWSFSCCFLR